MKILHIHPAMAGGGIEAMIMELSNAMVQNENVSVCSIFEPKKGDVFWNKLNPRVHKFSLGKMKQGFSIYEIFKIFNLLRKEKFDVVNMHGFFYYYAIAVLFLHRKIKFFYTVHSDAAMENSGWDNKLLFFKRFCFKKGWVYPITISDVSKESFTQFYGLDSQMIYNGIAKADIKEEDRLRPYRKTGDTKIFFHAGRISTPKNQLVLCQVFKYLIDKGHDVVLLIAGSKQMDDIFISISPYFSDRILYLGERNDIPQLMANSDAMCLPSIWEGFPVTLLEALSVGCIPICSPVGGIPNVIEDGQNGLLSASSSKDDYLKSVERFLSLTDEERQKMKECCLHSFLKFDIQNTVNNYMNCYKSKLC